MAPQRPQRRRDIERFSCRASSFSNSSKGRYFFPPDTGLYLRKVGRKSLNYQRYGSCAGLESQEHKPSSPRKIYGSQPCLGGAQDTGLRVLVQKARGEAISISSSCIRKKAWQHVLAADGQGKGTMGATILLVGADASSRSDWGTLLENYGYKVVKVSDANSALNVPAFSPIWY